MFVMRTAENPRQTPIAAAPMAIKIAGPIGTDGETRDKPWASASGSVKAISGVRPNSNPHMPNHNHARPADIIVFAMRIANGGSSGST